jgi:hypothetical protein
MAVPTPTEVRAFLENYGIVAAQLSDTWITARIANFIVPYVEKITRQSFSSVKTVTEYHSGNAKNILILDRRPIVAVTEISYVLGGNTLRILNLAMIETVANQGILKAKTNYDEAFMLPLFAKGEYNIKCTYTYGTTTPPDDVKEAMLYLAASRCLTFVGARTGGGSLGIQSHNRNYGSRGKYHDICMTLDADAHSLLRKYSTATVGS